MQRKPIHKVPGNKTKTRRQVFAEDSLSRKAMRHRKEQDAFDAETERLIAKYSQDTKKEES